MVMTKTQSSKSLDAEPRIPPLFVSEGHFSPSFPSKMLAYQVKWMTLAEGNTEQNSL
jgi:hypothetical protein